MLLDLIDVELEDIDGEELDESFAVQRFDSVLDRLWLSEFDQFVKCHSLMSCGSR